MRPTWVPCLVVATIIATCQFDGQASEVRGRGTTKVAARPAGSAEVKTFVVKGLGYSVADARESAILEAQKALVKYFEEQRLPLTFAPTDEFISNRMTEGESEGRQKVKDEEVPEIELTIVLREDDRSDILTQDRQVRMEYRQKSLGKGLLVMIGVLAALSAFFRLDDATKGYYTGLLKLAAIGLVGGLGAGLYFLS